MDHSVGLSIGSSKPELSMFGPKKKDRVLNEPNFESGLSLNSDPNKF